MLLLIIDPHPIETDGLRACLTGPDSHWKICAVEHDGRSALSTAARLRPDLAIIAHHLPHLSGLATAQQLKSLVPAIEILLFCHNATPYDLRRIRDSADVRGVVLQTEGPEEIQFGLQRIARHRNFYSTAFSAAWEELQAERETLRLLSRREADVLQKIGEGGSNKEIASALGISTKTVEGHRTKIMRKLQARSTADLVRLAIRQGLASA